MSLHLTIEMIELSYDLLRETPPFKRWKLPHSDEIQFDIIEVDTHSADYILVRDKTHRIRINNKWTGTLAKLIANLAHEMVHLRLESVCQNDRDDQHGPEFQRLAAQVCRHHGFDRKGF